MRVKLSVTSKQKRSVTLLCTTRFYRVLTVLHVAHPE